MQPTISQAAERANATIAQQVMLSALAHAHEGTIAHGVYSAVCRESVPAHRTGYMELFEQQQRLEIFKRKNLFKLTLAERIRLLDDLDQITLRLNDIPKQTVWEEPEFHNVVTTVGKNLALDTYLAGSAYTVTGPYMGLIEEGSYSAVAAADTMASHAGWLEATSYTAPRKTCAWSAASAGAKALSSALTFSMTAADTIKGCFIVYGTGAVSTVSNTAGTLYSAGLFTGGDQPVVNGNTLNVSYSTSL